MSHLARSAHFIEVVYEVLRKVRLVLELYYLWV